jgi:hypothetical protein
MDISQFAAKDFIREVPMKFFTTEGSVNCRKHYCMPALMDHLNKGGPVPCPLRQHRERAGGPGESGRHPKAWAAAARSVSPCKNRMTHKSGRWLSNNPVPENIFVKVDKNIHLYHVKDNQKGEMSVVFISVQMKPDQSGLGCLL